jgi:hypothetical protein
VATFTSESSDYSIPDSDLERSVEARGSNPPTPRLIPMPADKILFPRRMIYIEAVLYLLIATAAFGMGYLIGRGGGARPVAKDSTDAVGAKGYPVEGTVIWGPRDGQKQADAGAVVIMLPKDKSPNKPLSPVGFRADDPSLGVNDPAVSALKALGGATTRTGADGRFTLFVPRRGWYYILIISRNGTRKLGDALERADLKELGNYFEPPEEVLKRSRYRWIQRDVQLGIEPIKIDFLPLE